MEIYKSVIFWIKNFCCVEFIPVNFSSRLSNFNWKSLIVCTLILLQGDFFFLTFFYLFFVNHFIAFHSQIVWKTYWNASHYRSKIHQVANTISDIEFSNYLKCLLYSLLMKAHCYQSASVCAESLWLLYKTH